jgi:hypothetical protein
MFWHRAAILKKSSRTTEYKSNTQVQHVISYNVLDFCSFVLEN